MSTALAIAGVTAVLRHRLTGWLVDHDVASALGSAITVSVSAPDRVVPSEGTEESQLNIFFYQATPNQGWAMNGLPSHDPTGRFRLTNAPLGLNLHYLISAYSGTDLHAEILLGYAVQHMHEFPVLTREMIRTALNPGGSPPPALEALSDSGLADQVELLRITPQYLNTDELSKLWTATQSSYRPTAAYDVSVVLIEGARPTRPGLPVLSRGEVDPATGKDRGVVVQPSLLPPLPTIEEVRPAGAQPVAALGAAVTVIGHHLDGSSREVRLANGRFEIDEVLPAAGTQADRLQFTIPAAQAQDFPVGVYDLTALIVRPGETDARESNRLACVVAPSITSLPAAPVARDGDGDAAFSVGFTPAVREGQRATLLLGHAEIEPGTFAPPATSLDFVVEDAPVGTFLARLRVDGIESPIVDRAATPPVFLDLTVTIS